jgi:hypothetical protein
VSATADEQLQAIERLDRTLGEHRLDYWLFGGWAVDFWVGAVTREHDDIDVAAWRDDYEPIRAALTAAGWRHTPAADEAVGTRYRWGAALVEFTFVAVDEAGRIVIPFADAPVVWSHDPFGERRRKLDGVTARTIPLGLLTAGKATPRDDVEEAAKDRADFDALSRVTT